MQVGHLPKLRPANLPSSLRKVLSLALVYSTCPPVSVCGTDIYRTHCEVFLGSRNQSNLLCRNTKFPSHLDLSPEGFAFWRICLPKLSKCLDTNSLRCLTYPEPSLPSSNAPYIGPEYQPVIHRLRQHYTGLTLGPPNPTPTNVAWETLDFRRWGFSPHSRYSCRHSRF